VVLPQSHAGSAAARSIATIRIGTRMAFPLEKAAHLTQMRTPKANRWEIRFPTFDVLASPDQPARTP
jgi:hypothetical protein